MKSDPHGTNLSKKESLKCISGFSKMNANVINDEVNAVFKLCCFAVIKVFKLIILATNIR